MAGWEKVGSGGRGGTRPDVFGVGEKRGRGAARQKLALIDPIGAYLRKVNMRFHFKNAVYGCMLAPPVNRGLGSNHRRRRRRRPIICRPRDRFGSPPPFPPLDPLGTHIQTAPFRRPSCQYTPRLVLGSGTHRKMCVVCCLLGGGTILSGERKQIRHEDMRCHVYRSSPHFPLTGPLQINKTPAVLQVPIPPPLPGTQFKIYPSAHFRSYILENEKGTFSSSKSRCAATTYIYTRTI